MTRKKVKLAYITNDLARKVTYKNRMKVLISPNPRFGLLPWVQQVISKLETMSEMEKNKNMLNLKTFLSPKITKATKQLKNHCKED
ncbi:hypothetical protein Godav_023724 [Gossypium davidsonii]|uniref:Uncharacterized protein n=1 Tax=Gossypium davidsonii TaxID=34287 RepID=A0A7J8STF9_GOSDV|nr:hypothetical protein [Gossypium davidsonii]